MRSEYWLPRLFQLGLLLLLCAAAWQCRHGWPVSANLLDLLPHAQIDETLQLAQNRAQAPVARQLVALVGAPDRASAVAQARALGKRWTDSGLFEHVQTDFAVNLDTVRTQLLTHRIAMLPTAEQQLLETNPASYTQRRVREIVDPFFSASAVPLDQDWLGLTRHAEQTLRPPGAMRYDIATGTLQAEQDGLTWVLVRAAIRGNAFGQNDTQHLTERIQEDQSLLQTAGARLLTAGGVRYAEAGRHQAVMESTWIGVSAILGITLVLLLTLRSARVLLTFASVACGLVTGFVVCVAIFGSLHAMTLVVGVSLIGIAIDFPMHWLGKSYGMTDWQAWPAMHRVLPGLSISLATSLVGYLSLAFTPFPGLTQIAVFSSAGLLGAYACTVCQLPSWFQGWQPHPAQGVQRLSHALLVARDRLSQHKALRLLWLPVLLVGCVMGITRLNMHDDIRLWLSLPTPLLQQARQISEITGFMPTSQFFLVRAPDDDELLRRQVSITTALDQLKDQGGLTSYLALSQVTTPTSKQRQIQIRLAQLATTSEPWIAFEAIGIPVAVIQAELRHLSKLPPIDIEATLASPQAQVWRELWLGRHNGTSAAMITLQGLDDASPLAAIAAAVPGTELVDQRGTINRLFTATRIEAVKLKLASYLLAAVLLLATLGRAATWRILAVPLVAIACTLAALGYLDQPLTLFSLFGLLLVSAIGVDYAIFMYERVAGEATSLSGVILAAVTTLLSFGLLTLSRTPAISNFGLAIAFGIVFCLISALWVIQTPTTRNPSHHGRT